MEKRIPGLPLNQKEVRPLSQLFALCSKDAASKLNVLGAALYLWYDGKMHSSTCPFSTPFSQVPYPKTSVSSLPSGPWPEKYFSCIRVSIATSLRLIWKVSSCLSNGVTDVVALFLPWSGGWADQTRSNALWRATQAGPTGVKKLA